MRQSAATSIGYFPGRQIITGGFLYLLTEMEFMFRRELCNTGSEAPLSQRLLTGALDPVIQCRLWDSILLTPFFAG